MPVNGENAGADVYQFKNRDPAGGSRKEGEGKKEEEIGNKNLAITDNDQKNTSTAVNSNSDAKDDDLKCGWGCVAGSYLQKLRKVEIFLVACCLYSFSQGFVVGGLFSVVLSTIERRFDMNSVQTGMIAMGFDLSSIICLIPVSFYGGLGHKPRWIAAGSFIMGVGSMMFASPHFIAGPYSYKLVKDQAKLCGIDINLNCSLVVGAGPGATPEENYNSEYMYLMFFANMLHGVGASPVFTLVVAFLDENTRKKNAPIYLAFYYSMALIGPASGYIFGGWTLERFVDVRAEASLTPNDLEWVGAWWIGFLVSSFLLLLASIFLAAFPRDLPGKDLIMTEKKLNKIQMMEHFHGVDSQQLKSEDIVKSLKALVLNPVLGFINLCCAAEGALVSGFVTFAPKFVETSFNISASSAAKLIGLCTIPFGGLGIVIGGFLVKRYNMGGLQSLKLCLICVAAGLLLGLLLLVSCRDVRFAGINHPYERDSKTSVSLRKEDLFSACNADCFCSAANIDPVCGRGNINFVSPCFAGCRGHGVSQEGQGKKKIYTNCSCLDVHQGDSVTEGKCGEECRLLGLFMPSYSIIIFLTFICCTPLLTATIRSVPENQKPLALGFQWVVARIIGMVPAPIIFGSVIDRACLFWKSEPCDDRPGSCLLYTSENMGVYFFCIVLVYKSLSLVFIFSAHVLMRKMIQDSATAVLHKN